MTNPLNAPRVEIADDLRAAGLDAVTDPRAIKAPCVIVGLCDWDEEEARLKGRDCLTVSAEYLVSVLAAGPDGPGLEQLLGDAGAAWFALRRHRPSGATRNVYAVAGAELPAIEFTITKTVSLSEGA